MTYTVTYRDKGGHRIEECFEAANRDALFKMLDTRGISAIRVANGGRVGSRPSRGGNAARWRYRALPVAVVALIAGVAVWWMVGREESVPQPEETKRVAPVKVVKTQLPKPTTPKPPEPPAPKKDGPPWPERSPHPDGEWRHGEGPRSIAVTNGCLVTYPNYPGVQLVLPHPAFAAPFETLLDNEIARIITMKPGDDFIDVPLPKNFDEKFVQSILVPIEDKEDDTPEKAELKRQVRDARRILIDAANRGESPRQILMDEAKTLRRMMQTRDNFQRIINEQIQSGASDQDINDTVNAANKMLEREGIEGKVILPWKTKLRLQQGKAEGKILD